MITKTKVVSISRADYGKQTEIIIHANKLITSKNIKRRNLIKIYGPYNPKYICHDLGEEWLFKQYYSGHLKSLLQQFPKY